MPREIYTGFWLDHDKSGAAAATWTLSVAHASLLTNLLSVLISTVLVDSLFRILVVLLYSSRPLPDYPLGLVGEVYVSLRNTASLQLPRLELLLATLSSRNKGKGRKTALILFTPCFLLLALKTASFAIPTLIISSSPDEVALLKSGTCGFKIIDPATGFASITDELRETVESRRYAEERYDESDSRFATERIFPVDALPIHTFHNVSCPFDESLCLLGPLGAIAFDTGLLDSHKHLGINAPEHERVQYRWRSTCTPLNVTSKVRVLSDTTFDTIYISEDEPLMLVDLGMQLNMNKSHTFAYRKEWLELAGYDVRSISSLVGIPNKYQWKPIDSLAQIDADVTLVLIGTNFVTYTSKVYDPVFQATGEPISMESADVWNSDYVFRIIACADQHQYCNPQTSDCTVLNGTIDEFSSAFLQDGREGNMAQIATASRIYQNGADNIIEANVRSLGSNALIAQSLVPEHSTVSTGLPADQWHRETKRWFATGLAKLQFRTLEYPNISYPKTHNNNNGAGAGAVQLAQNFSGKHSVDSRLVEQCYQQRARLEGRGRNINVVGLVVLLVLTLGFWAGSLLARWWVERRPARVGGQMRWQQDDLLALWRGWYGGGGGSSYSSSSGGGKAQEEARGFLQVQVQ